MTFGALQRQSRGSEIWRRRRKSERFWEEKKKKLLVKMIRAKIEEKVEDDLGKLWRQNIAVISDRRVRVENI